GQALFLLRVHERGQIDHAAPGRLQLPRARHGGDAIHRRRGRPRRARRHRLAHRAEGIGHPVRRGHRPPRAGRGAARRYAALLRAGGRGPVPDAGPGARAGRVVRRGARPRPRLRPAHRFPGPAFRGQRRAARAGGRLDRSEGDLRLRAQGDDESPHRWGWKPRAGGRADRDRRQRSLHGRVPPPFPRARRARPPRNL
ncbi:MAG: Thymidine kinase, partial [uncultured Sphingomonadaceae bacterium]